MFCSLGDWPHQYLGSMERTLTLKLDLGAEYFVNSNSSTRSPEQEKELILLLDCATLWV